MRYASLVLFSVAVLTFALAVPSAAQDPALGTTPYHVGSDGVVYLHGPGEGTCASPTSQWIQPVQQDATWCAPPAACAPVQQYMVQPAQRQLTPLSWRIFGDFIYWRPSDAASISYALPINGAVLPAPTPPIPIGPVAAIDPTYEPGFRVGIGKALDHCSEISGTYTHYESDTSSFVEIDPLDVVVLTPLVLHPGTDAADELYTQASANGKIKMQLADLEYRRMIPDPAFTIGYVAGARYAHLDQEFTAQFQNVTTIEDVESDVNFNGGGIRVGLEADWRSKQTGFLVYSNGYGTIVAGNFKSSYTQEDNFLGTVVSTSREDARIVPMLELEVGVGWQSDSGHIRFSGGYAFSAWLNAVTNRSFIDAVQSGYYDDLSDTLYFDGLVTRVELKF